MFFDDENIESFLEQHFPEYRNVFHSFRVPIQRYDFFRYLAIYHYGGFYLDLDVFLARDLTPLLTSECVFPFEELTEIKYFWRQFGMDWQIGNYAFGATPGHPFLAAIIENCLRAKDDPAWVAPMMKSIPKPFRAPYYVTNTTGPGLVSRTFAENPQITESVNILFPDDVRDPRVWHQFGNFGVHHMVGSWRKRRSLLSFPLKRFWDAWSLRRITAHSKGTGKTRHPDRLAAPRTAPSTQPQALS
jgi:inositol phosphorylceramide mannosyltransferase catalytic subunit